MCAGSEGAVSWALPLRCGIGRGLGYCLVASVVAHVRTTEPFKSPRWPSDDVEHALAGSLAHILRISGLLRPPAWRRRAIESSP